MTYTLCTCGRWRRFKLAVYQLLAHTVPLPGATTSEAWAIHCGRCDGRSAVFWGVR